MVTGSVFGARIITRGKIRAAINFHPCAALNGRATVPLAIKMPLTDQSSWRRKQIAEFDTACKAAGFGPVRVTCVTGTPPPVLSDVAIKMS